MARYAPRLGEKGSSGVTSTDEVYGYAVICTFRRQDGTAADETRTYRSKGKSIAKAERTPIFKRGFVSIDKLEPYTREQWLRVFGEGRM